MFYLLIENRSFGNRGLLWPCNRHAEKLRVWIHTILSVSRMTLTTIPIGFPWTFSKWSCNNFLKDLDRLPISVESATVLIMTVWVFYCTLCLWYFWQVSGDWSKFAREICANFHKLLEWQELFRCLWIDVYLSWFLMSEWFFQAMILDAADAPSSLRHLEVCILAQAISYLIVLWSAKGCLIWH